MLSPLLFMLYTYDCNPQTGENSAVKFVDDTTIIDRISNNDETLAEWYTENNLLLSYSKTKELIIDFIKKGSKDSHPCLHQWSCGGAGEQFQVPGNQQHKEPVMVISTLVRKAQEFLHFLKELKKAKFPCQVLVNFYRVEMKLKHPD